MRNSISMSRINIASFANTWSSLLTHKELCLHGRACAQVVAELLLRHFLIIIRSLEYQSLHGCFVILKAYLCFCWVKGLFIVYMHGSNLACCFRCFRYLWPSRLLLISLFIYICFLAFSVTSQNFIFLLRLFVSVTPVESRLSFTLVSSASFPVKSKNL